MNAEEIIWIQEDSTWRCKRDNRRARIYKHLVAGEGEGPWCAIVKINSRANAPSHAPDIIEYNIYLNGFQNLKQAQSAAERELLTAPDYPSAC